MLQPDVHKWLDEGKVSMHDVPNMLAWPLHPVQHLRGDISDLATMKYSSAVLGKLGITYSYMRSQLLMDDDWMKMLRYKPCEWGQHLKFDEQSADEMGDLRVFKVFGMDVAMIKLALHAAG